MLGLLVQNQSHRAGTHLRGKLLRRIAHQTFFSGEMVSANPGAVHQDTFQSGDHLRKLVQRTAAVELSRVMGNDLDAKDAFALGIDLQSQLAAVQLEDRQIIGLSTATSHSAERFVRWRYFGRCLYPRIVLMVLRSSGARLRSMSA